MKRVAIDFAPKGWRQQLYRSSPWALALLALALLCCALVAWQVRGYAARQDELAVLQAALAARSLSAAPVRPVVQPPQLNAAQATALNDVIHQLNLPWADLGDALAEATPASIALLSLEPDARRRLLRVSAEARSSDEMLAYVARLQQSEVFSTVTLTRHELVERDPNHPVRFQISAQWGAP